MLFAFVLIDAINSSRLSDLHEESIVSITWWFVLFNQSRPKKTLKSSFQNYIIQTLEHQIK